MDHEFTCAWERLHRVRLSSLAPDVQRRVMLDRSRERGVLDLRLSLESFQPVRRAA